MITKIKKIKKSRPPSFFKRKRDISSYRTIFSSIFLVLAILIVIIFLVVSNIRSNNRRTELNLRIENLKKDIEILEERKQEFSANISQIPTEDYLEKEARERFNLKKPGEEVVVVLPPEQEEEEKPEEQKSFWQRILEKIGF